MATETLHFDNPRFAQSLYANEPKNLRLLEDLLQLKVVAREDWISLDGEPGNVALAKRLFGELQRAVQRGAVIRRQEFSQAVNAITRGEVPPLRELADERVEVSSRKRAVSPRTVGQKKYIEAIRTHDIVIGIGPAGTGKTYLAMAMAVNALRTGRVARIILCRPAVEAGEALGYLPRHARRKSHAVSAPALRRAVRHDGPRRDSAEHGAGRH